MGRHLSVATAIEVSRIASPVAFVPLIDVVVNNPVTGAYVETLYFARNSENITWHGNVYEASAFDFDVQEETGQVPRVTVTVKDYSQAIIEQMESYGGGVGFSVVLSVVNAGNLAQAPELQETFTVVSAMAQDYVVSFTLGIENPLMMRCPRRRQFRDYCNWRYKDSATCGYNGTKTSCDYTMWGGNGCLTHSDGSYGANQFWRFGGFPGIGINQQGI